MVTVVYDRNVLVQSRFDEGMDGWSRRGDCTLTHSPNEGNPGGCLKAVDAVTGIVFYYLAPLKFLGDKRTAYHLDYDIKWVNSNDPLVPADRELELVGGGMVLIYNPGPPPRNTWVHRSVPLRAAPGWTNATKKRPATDQDFGLVRAKLEKLAIRGEFAYGGPEIGYLDNVVMYGYPFKSPNAPTS